MEKPLVSIIITTKNEEKNIRNCLESIKEQNFPKIEVIVVDNNSEDRTKEIAGKYTKNVFNRGPERSAQRNFGIINKARGKYVIYLDADMILSPLLIEKCVKFMESGKFVALHIPEAVLGKGYFSKVRRFERGFYNGTVIDASRFFLKSSFNKVKGFDEKLNGPEDWDIDKKIKKIGKIGLLEVKDTDKNWKLKQLILENGVDYRKYGCVIYHNEAKFNLKKYLRKKSYYSKSFDDYMKKWDYDEDIKKQFEFYYRFLGVFIENGKWKKLIIHPLLAFGMYFLRIMTGFSFLLRKK